MANLKVKIWSKAMGDGTWDWHYNVFVPNGLSCIGNTSTWQRAWDAVEKFAKDVHAV